MVAINTWAYEPIWVANERKRRAMQQAQQQAAPYLQSGRPTDLATASGILQKANTTGGLTYDPIQMAAQRIAAGTSRGFLDLLDSTPGMSPGAPSGAHSATPAQQPKQQQPKQDDGGGGFGGFVHALTSPFSDIRDTAGDVAHGRWGELGTDAASSGLGLLNLLDVPARYGVRPAIKATTGLDVQGYIDDPNANPFLKVLAGAATDPLTYVGPGAIKSVAGKALGESLAGRIAEHVLENPLKVSAAATLGSAAGAQIGHDIGGPVGETIGSLTGGLLGGTAINPVESIIRGAWATPLRKFGNRLIEDDAAGSALVHALQIDAGTTDRPLSLAEQTALQSRGAPEVGHQASFAEAIPQQSRITGMPVRWTEQGVNTALGEAQQGYGEYFGSTWHQFEQPTIYVNDASMAAPPSDARDLAIRLRLIPHEEAHGIWDTLGADIKSLVDRELNQPANATTLRVKDDLQKRWGQVSPQEAFAEAWASKQAGQETPYTRLLGNVVEKVQRGLDPETQQALAAQRRQIVDWAPKLDEAALATGRRPNVTMLRDATVEDPWYWVQSGGKNQGFITRTANGKWRVAVGADKDAQRLEFNSLAEAQQYIFGKGRNLMPFGKGPGDAPAQDLERRIIPISQDKTLPWPDAEWDGGLAFTLAQPNGSRRRFAIGRDEKNIWSTDAAPGQTFASADDAIVGGKLAQAGIQAIPVPERQAVELRYGNGEMLGIVRQTEDDPLGPWTYSNTQGVGPRFGEPLALSKDDAIRRLFDTIRTDKPQPLARDRLWFHGTSSMDYDVPDPEHGVMGITQGPGVYMAANPDVSKGYGERLFAAEFDGNVGDLTADITPTAPMFEGGPSWEDVRKGLVKRVQAALDAVEPGSLDAIGQKQRALNDAMFRLGKLADWNIEDVAAVRSAAKLRKVDLESGVANGYAYRDALVKAIAPAAGVDPSLLGQFKRVGDSHFSSSSVGVGMAAVNDELSRQGVDAIFHHSPGADGDVLIVLNGDKARVRADFPGSMNTEAGATLADLKDYATEQRPRKIVGADRTLGLTVGGTEDISHYEYAGGDRVELHHALPANGENYWFIRGDRTLGNREFYATEGEAMAAINGRLHKTGEADGGARLSVKTPDGNEWTIVDSRGELPPVAAAQVPEDSPWTVFSGQGYVAAFPSREAALTYIADNRATARFYQKGVDYHPDGNPGALDGGEALTQAPDKPTFLGMQPSEIAEVLGVDKQNRKLFNHLKSLDDAYRNKRISPAQAKERGQLSAVLRKAYADANDGRAPVWVLPPGYREQWTASVEKRAQAMRDAGWTEAEIQAAIPDKAFSQSSHTASEYLGQKKWQRLMQMEKLASDGSLNATTRLAARQNIFRELGVPMPSSDRVPPLVARSMEERMLQAPPPAEGESGAPSLQVVRNGDIVQRPDLFQGRDADPGKSYNEANVRGILKNYDPVRREPGLLISDTSRNGELVVARGHHRLEVDKRRAAAGDAPDTNIWQVVQADLSDPATVQKMKVQALLSNYGSRSTNVREDLRVVRALKEGGAEVGSVAEQMGITQNKADDLLALTNLPDDAISAAVRGGNDYGNLAEVGRVVGDYGLTEAEARAMTRRYGPGGKSASMSRTQVRDALGKFAADFRADRANNAQASLFGDEAMADANVDVLDNIDRMVKAEDERNREIARLTKLQKDVAAFPGNEELQAHAKAFTDAVDKKVEAINGELNDAKAGYEQARQARAQRAQQGGTQPPGGEPIPSGTGPAEGTQAGFGFLDQLAPEAPKEPPPAPPPTVDGVPPGGGQAAVSEVHRTMWDHVASVMGLPRTLVSSIDMGGVARQGGILGISYPSEWKAAIAAQFKAYRSEGAADALRAAREADPDAILLAEHGLYFGPWGDRISDLKDSEEKFMTGWASKIPGVRASERSYVEGINQQRWLVGKRILADWRADYGPDLPAEKLQALSEFINVATGRGSVPEFFKSPMLNNLLFSPRFLASRVQLIKMGIRSSDPEVRAMAQKAIGRYFGTGAAIASLAAASGVASVSLDPNSSDFGKIRVGNTRYDIWGGYQPLFRYFANFVSGTSSSGEPQDRLTTLGKFARSKLAPVPGAVVNILQGETALGENVSPNAGSLQQLLVSNTVPLFLQDAAQAFRDDGVVGVAKVAPGFFGVGTQNYTPRTAQLDQKAQALADLNPKDYPDGVGGFYDLLPKDRDAIKRANPELWQAYYMEGSSKLKKSETLRAELEAKQQNLDEQLLTGKLPVDQWQKQYESLRDELRFRRKEIYGDQPMKESDAKTPVDKYFYALQQVDDGAMTMDDVDAWKATLPAADQKMIDDNTGLNGTSLVRLYKKAQQTYYDLPQFVGYTADEGQAINQLVGYARDGASGDQQRALALVTKYGQGQSARILSAARRVILGGALAPKEDPRRAQFRANNPLYALLGNGYLQPSQASRIKALLARSTTKAA